MSDNRATVIVIAGPTCVGKTEVALDLCRRFDGELVGADSVQVYRGFDIGSSKPSAAELGGVPHRLIDVIEPDEAIDAARYAALADQAITDVRARGRVPVVVGGTGLWLRALLRGLLSLPPPDPTLRARLEADWDADGGGALHRRLRAVDPLAAAAIHENDRLRVVRALEVHAQTGQALGALRAAHRLGAPRYRSLMWVIDMPGAHHAARVRARTKAMWDAGFADEVAALLRRYPPSARGFGAVGYREVVRHVRGDLTAEETREEIVRSTLAYAKRQRTWFRSEPSVDARLEASDALTADRLAELAAFLDHMAPS